MDFTKFLTLNLDIWFVIILIRTCCKNENMIFIYGGGTSEGLNHSIFKFDEN